MTIITEQRLTQLLKAFEGKRIAVIGDLMLDRYIWGSVGRISPEAPVPVVDVENEQSRLGGAANVAQNVKTLGGSPLLVGVVGNDSSGQQIIQHIKDMGCPTDGIVVDPSRPTTVKTRIIAHDQHVVRIDWESRQPINGSIETSILDSLKSHLKSLDGIILEDYNKGVIVTSLIHNVTEMANKAGTIVTVDPKFSNFFEYKNVTVFKPNRKEVEEALGVHLRSDVDVIAAGREILSRLGARHVLITRGEHGMTLFEADGNVSHVATKARNVADVSGAGDTVVATLTMALAGGASMREASTLANFAGGVVCGYVGIVPIDREELRTSILDDHTP